MKNKQYMTDCFGFLYKEDHEVCCKCIDKNICKVLKKNRKKFVKEIGLKIIRPEEINREASKRRKENIKIQGYTTGNKMCFIFSKKDIIEEKHKNIIKICGIDKVWKQKYPFWVRCKLGYFKSEIYNETITGKKYYIFTIKRKGS